MKEYDLIFGVGEGCACTQLLRSLNLQFYSYPFDWLYGSHFENRIKLLIHKFKDFINKEDLEYSHEVRSIKCQAYHNKANDITFNHDFLNVLPFDEAYEDVKQKYDRRINRLISQIEKANSILIVYLEVPSSNHKTEEESTIIRAFDEFKAKYSDKEVDLFYIKNVLNQQDIKIKKLTNNITLFELNYKKIDEEFDYVVDMPKLFPIFRNIKFKNVEIKLIKKYFHKTWIMFVPIKNLRHKLRKNFHC